MTERSPTTPECDMCEAEPGEHHPDIAIRLCPDCRALFDDYRRGGYEYVNGSKAPGPAPRLTAFRLGRLANLFRDGRAQRKLERLADAL